MWDAAGEKSLDAIPAPIQRGEPGSPPGLAAAKAAPLISPAADSSLPSSTQPLQQGQGKGSEL